MVKSTVDGSSVPSFLMKCYEMVDDQSTDRVISWSESNDSFVIWNMADFTLHLLPKYFKHNNFSSFMRQLNIYGFRKSDTDRWEFSNDGFIRGQQQLLKNILRRKNIQALNQRKSSQQKHDKSDSTGQEIENTGLWKEVESLKIDKNALMQELLKLRQLQETSKNKLQGLGERLQGMETDQQQMLSFLIMAIQSPGFLDQLLQPKENNWHKSEVGKNMLVEVAEGDEALSSDGMLIGYHHPSPAVDEMSNSAKPTELDLDGYKDLYINADFMKIFMDENQENHSPLRSDLSDNSVLQQLLLSHHLLDKTLDYKFDTDEPNDESIMDIESTIDLPEMENFLSYEMEKSLSCEMEKSLSCEMEKSLSCEMEKSLSYEMEKSLSYGMEKSLSYEIENLSTTQATSKSGETYGSTKQMTLLTSQNKPAT